MPFEGHFLLWNLDQAVAEVDGAVGDLCKGFIVGDDDEGLTKLVAEVEEELVEFGLVLGVEGAGGLIGENHGRTVDEGAGYGHALFLTAGEFVGLMGGSIGQSHEVEQFLGTLLGPSSGEARNIGWNHNILNRRELRQELMKLEHEAEVLIAEIGQFLRREGGHIYAIDTYRTAVGTVEGADNLQQGGLPGPRWPDNTDNLPPVDMEVDTFEYF